METTDHRDNGQPSIKEATKEVFNHDPGSLAALVLPQVRDRLLNEHRHTLSDLSRVVFFVDYQAEKLDTTMYGKDATGIDIKLPGASQSTTGDERDHVEFITSLMQARVSWDKIYFARVIADFEAMTMDAEIGFKKDGKKYKKTEKNIL